MNEQETIGLPKSGRAEVLRNVFTGLLGRVMQYEVKGLENLETIRKSPSVLVFAFHYGHFDGPSVRLGIPKSLRHLVVFWAAKDYWYEGWRGFMTSRYRFSLSSLLFHTIPISRGDVASRGGLEETIRCLDQGYSVVISIEGTRSNKAILERRFHDGVAQLVLNKNVPVIPVVLKGHEDVMLRGKIIPRFRKDGKRRVVQVIFGEPIIFDTEKLEDTPKQQRAAITEKIRETLVSMYDPALAESLVASNL